MAEIDDLLAALAVPVVQRVSEVAATTSLAPNQRRLNDTVQAVLLATIARRKSHDAETGRLRLTRPT